MGDDLWYDIYEDSQDYEEYADDSVHWDEEEFESSSFQQMLHTCAVPAIKDIMLPLSKLFLSCCLIRFFLSLGVFHINILHFITVTCGVWITYSFFGKEIIYLIIFSFGIYAILFGVHLTSKISGSSLLGVSKGCLTTLLTAVFLLVCELFVVADESWHTIRGSQMIMSMKVISIAFDMDSKQISKLPSMISYFSYCFTPCTVIFGPWTNYNDYVKVMSRTSVNSLWWILRFFCNFVVAIIFLTTSTCWTSWLFKGGLNPASSHWILAYGDALSYRSSHYFVSFVSEASATIGGFSSSLKVAKPHVIEVPRSLVNIVTNWNIPMHCWLKTYVFKVSLPYGTFIAILATYAASSLLHGLNFQLSAVLLSLGFYTFIEYALRSKLASIFDACILARKCKLECNHLYKEDHSAVIAANVLFGALTLFHLTYLGFMFDGTPELEETGYNMSHTLSKWGELNYVSHWTMLATFIFYKLI